MSKKNTCEITADLISLEALDFFKRLNPIFHGRNLIKYAVRDRTTIEQEKFDNYIKSKKGEK